MFSRPIVVALSALHASGDTGALKALPKASRRAAASRHWPLIAPVAGSWQSQAPRPGARRSTVSDPSAHRATRTRIPAGAGVRQPTHVLVGSGVRVRDRARQTGRNGRREQSDPPVACCRGRRVGAGGGGPGLPFPLPCAVHLRRRRPRLPAGAAVDGGSSTRRRGPVAAVSGPAGAPSGPGWPALPRPRRSTHRRCCRPATTASADTASPPSAGCQTISPASFSTHSPSAHSWLA